MNIRVENWNGHDIRFVEKESSEWWAVASDVAKALGYRMASDMTRFLDSEEKGTHNVRMEEVSRKMSLISETGIYEAVFNSRRDEAKDFKRWVKQLIKTLRQSTGLEGFQIFRMLDKDHQREAMRNLSSSLRQPIRRDFIKANTIADKAVSSKFGHPKMLKKNQMTPDMLVARQPILEDTVSLMSMVDHFKLDLSVSKTIYEKHA
ncbi:Bro-N domain-containing protein [Paenibacillus alvei]|uniref:BRO-N domain-containing protein n=1 Tax=Paenibacillus alvei TaxID=44250 RepID=UPI002280C66F|nr:Bro-N domain-containing protein [Paenibacillus alvei]MCY7486379.1 Bro-N domain-containing protein [Paenibacillus alvei]